jgi:PAS domain S-box-containing protein
MMKMNYLVAISIFLSLIISTSYSQESQLPAKPKTLTAVILLDAPPTYYRDNKTGEAAGFAVDVINAIGKKTGYSITFQFKKDFQEMIDAVKNGTADISPSLGISEERMKVLSFTLPIQAEPVSVFVRAGSKITGLEDDMRVGVMKGSISFQIIHKLPQKVRLITYDSFQGGLHDLLAGQIEAFSGHESALLTLARNAGIENRIKIAGAPLTELKRAIAMRKGNSRLLAELNKAVDDFVDTPQYNQLYTKWYGAPKRYWTVQRVIIYSVVVIIVIVIIMAGWRHYSILILNNNLVLAKEQLIQSEHFPRTIIETAPECLELIDIDGNILFMNNAGLEMIEATSLKQAKGQCVYHLVTSEYRNAFMTLTKDVCEGGSGTLEFEIVGLKGGRHWLETHAVPYRNEINKTTVLLGITRDITERKSQQKNC